jgi:hypothetical protein
MSAGSDVPGRLTAVGWYQRRPVGRPPICRLDATAGGYCHLVVSDDRGGERTIFTVPVTQVDHVSLDVGNLVITVGGRKHRIILAPPDTTARLGMGMSAFGGAAPAGALAGSAVAGWRMARREKQVDPEGLRWLRLFADHGVEVEAPQLWKQRVRYGLVGVACLITAIGILGSIAGVAEEGGWTAEARNGVFGMSLLVGLIWAIYWATARLLRRTVPRDTARRVRRDVPARQG